MKPQHQLAAYLGLLGMTVLIAILVSIRDRLIALGPWVLGVLLTLCSLVLLYYLHKLYVLFRADRLRLIERVYEVEGKRQALTIEQERWEVERASLLLGQHLQSARIYPDAKGYMPTLINIAPEGDYQYVHLPHPAHQARVGGNQQLMLPEHANSLSQAIPTSIRYEEIRAQIPRGRSCLGVSENGVEHCDFGQLMTMWICGGSSTGKSNTVALKIDEAIRNGRKIGIVLVDPHARKEDSLYKKIQCYEQHFLFQVAISEEQILGALEWFKAEFERRLQEGGQGQTDILLVVDEVSNVVESDDPEIGKLIKKIARICGQESRGFGMFGWFISQDAAGLAWLRKRAMTVIAHKLNMMSERKLACNEDLDIARDMDQWPRGRVAVYGLNFQGVMVTQMPAFTPPVVEGSIEPESDEMETLQPKKERPIFDESFHPVGNSTVGPGPAFRSRTPNRSDETVSVSGDETNGDEERDTNKILAFRVSEQDTILSAKKEAPSVSDEMKKTILRMHRAGMPWREIARLVGLSGEKYGQFKQACRELGIQPGQVAEG